jgi:hypothetical protein
LTHCQKLTTTRSGIIVPKAQRERTIPKKKLAVEIVWSELLLYGGEWKTRKQIYEELLAEGYERRYVDWYLFCLSNHQPKENAMDEEQIFQNAILSEIKDTIADLRKLGEAINRGTGGREVSLAITNMQYAQWSLEEAIRLREQSNP